MRYLLRRSAVLTALLIIAGILPVPASPRGSSPGPGDGYTNVTGTRVHIAMPDGMALIDNPLSTRLGDWGEYIMVLVDTGTGFYETSAPLRQAAGNLPEEVRMFGFEEPKIDGYDSALATFEEHADGMEMITMLMGDSTFTVITTAVYDGNRAGRKEDVRESLLTMRYDRDMVPDPEATMPFRVEANGSGYEFRDYFTGNYVFGHSDGEDGSEYLIVIAVTVPDGRDMDRIADDPDEIIRLIFDWPMPLEVRHMGRSEADGHTVSEMLIYEEADDEGDNGLYITIVRRADNPDTFLLTLSNGYWLKDLSDLDLFISGPRDFSRALRLRPMNREQIEPGL